MDKVLLFENSERLILSVSGYEKEKELQELVKEHPAIIEISSIFDSPLLIIGREIFWIDVLGITLSGVPVIIECKRKENPDMRYLIAQLFEYGSILKDKSFTELDEEVKRYFNSPKCQELTNRNKSLLEALMNMIKREGEEEIDTTMSETVLKDKICENLKKGNFILIVVADKVDSKTRGTIDFLNSKLNDDIRIEIVEIRKFKVSPPSTREPFVFVPMHANPVNIQREKSSKSVGKITVEKMLSNATSTQQEFVQQVIQKWEKEENCSIEMGTVGLSMLYDTLSVFWLFVDKIQIASCLKKQIEKNGKPATMYNDICGLLGDKKLIIDRININDFKEKVDKILEILKEHTVS